MPTIFAKKAADSRHRLPTPGNRIDRFPAKAFGHALFHRPVAFPESALFPWLAQTGDTLFPADRLAPRPVP